MTQIPEYIRGWRDARRQAITFLHRRAGEMNDGHARAVINLMADELGREMPRRLMNRTDTALRDAAETK